MRVATGVILIIAALFNLIAAFGYFAGGAVTGGITDMADSTYVEQSKSGMTDEQKEQFDKDMAKIKGEVGGSAIGLMAYGIFLLVSVGILIAGAVFLFQDKKPQFIMIAGVVAIVAELIGMLIASFGILNILGLVGGILAIISAKSMTAGSADPDQAA